MADINQFGSARLSQTADAKVCARFETMLAEAVDGTLTAAEGAEFDLHLLGCAACSGMLADAQRGAAWMGMLRGQMPEPPAAMVERILAGTSGARAAATGGAGVEIERGMAAGMLTGIGGGLANGGSGAAIGSLGPMGPIEMGMGARVGAKVLPFRSRLVQSVRLGAVGHTLLQPRLAMTAAMAFFSIALTLNLTGVRLSDFEASDLKPSSLRRSIYNANAHVVRYYTNLRVVYELESRVRDLQRSTEDDAPSASAGDVRTKDPGAKGAGVKDGAGDGSDPAAQPDSGGKAPEKQQPRRHANPGTSRREPFGNDPRRGDSAMGTLRAELVELPALADRAGALGRNGGWNQALTAPAGTNFVAMFGSRTNLPAQERGTV